jgi:hypothetical protein
VPPELLERLEARQHGQLGEGPPVLDAEPAEQASQLSVPVAALPLDERRGGGVDGCGAVTSPAAAGAPARLATTSSRPSGSCSPRAANLCPCDYAPPGHVPVIEAGTEIVEFSPTRGLQRDDERRRGEPRRGKLRTTAARREPGRSHSLRGGRATA